MCPCLSEKYSNAKTKPPCVPMGRGRGGGAVQGGIEITEYIGTCFHSVVVVVLTLTHNSMQSVDAGQAPITLEWKKYLK